MIYLFVHDDILTSLRLTTTTEQLTRCKPLQKLKVRLGTCKTDLSPPVILYILLIVPRRYFCGVSYCFMSWCLNCFVLLAPYVCYHILVKFRYLSGHLFGK